MKKSVVVFASFILASVLLSYFVSAQSPVNDLKSVLAGTTEVLTSIAETILGPGPTELTTTVTVGDGFLNVEMTKQEFIFARFLFLLIIFAVVWSVVSRISMFESSTWMVVIISGGVSLLATRFLMQPEWIKVILLPYSALGIAVTSLIPLIIYFYFLENIDSRFLRRAGWSLAAVVFVGLWFSRYNEIRSNAIYVYPAAALLCLIVMAADGTIQRAFARAKTGKAMSPMEYQLYGHYMDQINNLMRAQSNLPGGVNTKEYKDIEKQIESLRKKAESVLAKAKE